MPSNEFTPLLFIQGENQGLSRDLTPRRLSHIIDFLDPEMTDTAGNFSAIESLRADNLINYMIDSSTKSYGSNSEGFSTAVNSTRKHMSKL